MLAGIKFVQGETEIEFDEFDAPIIDETTVQDINVTQFTVGGHGFYAFPEKKKRFVVTLNRKSVTVSTKINALANLTGILDFYPYLNYDDSYHLNVVRLAEERKTVIGWGHEITGTETMTFQEA